MKTNMNGIKLEIQEHWSRTQLSSCGTVFAQSPNGYDPFADDIIMWMVFEKPLQVVIDQELNDHLLCMFTMQATELPCNICQTLCQGGDSTLCYVCHQDGLHDPFERGVERAAEEHYGYHSGENYEDDVCDNQSEFATIKDKLASLGVK